MDKRKRHQSPSSSSSLSEKSNQLSVHVESSPIKTKLKSKKSQEKLTKTQQLRKYRMYLMRDALKRSKKIPKYEIPEMKLRNALNMLDNVSLFPKTKLWQVSCQSSIHEINSRKHEIVTRKLGKLLKEARKCLLKRDWYNLAKILCMVKPLNGDTYDVYFDIFKKYAQICLIHNPDKQLLNNFKQGILSSTDNDIDDVLFRKITRRFDDDYNNGESSDDSDNDDSSKDDGENDHNDMNDDDDDDDDE